MQSTIHPTAIIGQSAVLGQGVTVGPYTVIEDDVEIGDGTMIWPHVHIASGARIGRECKIHSGAVLANEPQDLKFSGEKTYLYVGDRNVIRECVQISQCCCNT